MTSYSALEVTPIETEVTYHRPRQTYRDRVTLEDPALEVMTDFTRVTAISINPCAGLQQARERMESSGVHLLFVTNQYHEVLGLITINDLNGPKPMQKLSENGGRMEDLMVRDIMTPRHQLEALDFEDVRKAKVGHLVETLKRMGRRHALVVERQLDNGRQIIRGVFSSHQIGQLLGQTLDDSHMAGSIAELATHA